MPLSPFLSLSLSLSFFLYLLSSFYLPSHISISFSLPLSLLSLLFTFFLPSLLSLSLSLSLDVCEIKKEEQGKTYFSQKVEK